MHNLIYHNHKLLRNLLMVSMFFLFMSASAQDDEMDDTQVDVIADSLPSHSETGYFDNVISEEVTPVSERKVDDTVLGKIRKDESYWYANLAPEQKKIRKDEENDNRGLISKSWFRNLMWLLILSSFIAVIIWYLVSSNVKLFRKPTSGLETEEGEPVSEDIFNLDYENEIRQASNRGDYRMATRLLFLGTLKLLSENEFIEYKHEKTNADYLKELSGTGLYKDFFRLTRDFEYTWYGHFELSQKGFEQVAEDFSRFKQQFK